MTLEPDEDLPHVFEGMFFRWRCESCDFIHDEESDIRRQVLKCQNCGHVARVEGD